MNFDDRKTEISHLHYLHRKINFNIINIITSKWNEKNVVHRHKHKRKQRTNECKSSFCFVFILLCSQNDGQIAFNWRQMNRTNKTRNSSFEWRKKMYKKMNEKFCLLVSKWNQTERRTKTKQNNEKKKIAQTQRIGNGDDRDFFFYLVSALSLQFLPTFHCNNTKALKIYSRAHHVPFHSCCLSHPFSASSDLPVNEEAKLKLNEWKTVAERMS